MTIVSYGVDWLTLSSPNYGLSACWDAMDREVTSLVMGGDLITPTSWRGGYKGVSIGPLRMLTRDDWELLIISGSLADEYLLELSGLWGKDTRCTRVDYQVTVAPVPDFLRVGERTIELAELSARGMKYNRMSGKGGGDTSYVGGRSSASFGRVYNKSADPRNKGGFPTQSWRWEVEYKRELATPMMLRAINNHSEIVDTVHKWYADRGITNLPFVRGEKGNNFIIPKRVTDTDRTLLWLRTSVQPSVRRLVGAGYVRDVLNALGIASSPIVARHILEALKALGHSLHD